MGNFRLAADPTKIINFPVSGLNERNAGCDPTGYPAEIARPPILDTPEVAQTDSNRGRSVLLAGQAPMRAHTQTRLEDVPPRVCWNGDLRAGMEFEMKWPDTGSHIF